MNDIEARLTKCFQVVFPHLSEADITAATQDSVAVWDSIATITLANVIEDEFHQPVDFDQLSELTSFERFRQYLTSATGIQ